MRAAALSLLLLAPMQAAKADGLDVSVGDVLCSNYQAADHSCYGIYTITDNDGDRRNFAHRSRYRYDGIIVEIKTYRSDRVEETRACRIADYRESEIDPADNKDGLGLKKRYDDGSKSAVSAGKCYEHRRCGDYYVAYRLGGKDELERRYRVDVFKRGDPKIEELTLRVRTRNRTDPPSDCEPTS